MKQTLSHRRHFNFSRHENFVLYERNQTNIQYKYSNLGRKLTAGHLDTIQTFSVMHSRFLLIVIPILSTRNFVINPETVDTIKNVSRFVITRMISSSCIIYVSSLKNYKLFFNKLPNEIYDVIVSDNKCFNECHLQFRDVKKQNLFKCRNIN